MKTKHYTIRNIEEALKKLEGLEKQDSQDGSNFRTFRFLKALQQTTPGERENIVIVTIEPE